MKKIAVLHPRLVPDGGGQAVATWTLQALRAHFELSLFTWDEPDLDSVNRTFGTSLAPSDFTLYRPSAPLRALVDAMSTPARSLRRNLLIRLCRKVDRSSRFAVLLQTEDEGALWRPGIQYVHRPHAFRRATPAERIGLQRIPGAVAAYRGVSSLFWRHRADRVRRNLTLVNSSYTRAAFRRIYGGDSTVVHPPVAGSFPDVPWEKREAGFACVSRFARYKRQHEVVAIVEELRRRGHALALHLIGTVEDPAYLGRLRDAERRNGDWLRVHVDLPRARMIELLSRQRYGIHAMPGEDFGIAVAELARSGCIPFVPTFGGAAEIVGNDPRLLFADDREAVERIECVLNDSGLQADLRRSLAEGTARFSAERFMDEMREQVNAFLQRRGVR